MLIPKMNISSTSEKDCGVQLKKKTKKQSSNTRE